MIVIKTSKKIPLTSRFKETILEKISEEENGNLKHSMVETMYKYINRPMTSMRKCRGSFVFGTFRMLFAITITIYSAWYNLHSLNSNTTKLILTIVSFEATLLYILSNLIYFFKMMKVLDSYNLSPKPPLLKCYLTEFMRVCQYISIPFMLLFVLSNQRRLLYIPYFTFVATGYLSNILEYNFKEIVTVLKLVALIGGNLILIIFPTLFELETTDIKAVYKNICLSYGIILGSIIIISQSKYLNGIITNKDKTSFILKVFEGTFFANIIILYFYNLHIYWWCKYIVLVYNCALGLASFFIPFMFSNLQLKIPDIQKTRTRYNLSIIFYMFDDLKVDFISFKQYFTDLRIKLLRFHVETSLSKLCIYINNIGGNPTNRLIDAIEDFSKFNKNANITFDGFFNYSPERIRVITVSEWAEIINGEKNFNIKLERFRNLIIMQYLYEKLKVDYTLFDISIPINMYLSAETEMYKKKEIISSVETCRDMNQNKIKTENKQYTPPLLETEDSQEAMPSRQGIEKENSTLKETNYTPEQKPLTLCDCNGNESHNSVIGVAEGPEHKLFLNLIPEDSDSLVLYKCDKTTCEFNYEQKAIKEADKYTETKPLHTPVKKENSTSNVIENNTFSPTNNTISFDISSTLTFDPNSSINENMNIVSEASDKDKTLLTNHSSSLLRDDVVNNNELTEAQRKLAAKRKRRVTIIDPLSNSSPRKPAFVPTREEKVIKENCNVYADKTNISTPGLDTGDISDETSKESKKRRGEDRKSFINLDDLNKALKNLNKTGEVFTHTSKIADISDKEKKKEWSIEELKLSKTD
ncbi:hypothetical protein CDIK_2231 [Cucumispora dikerogammari]|nr:hypothetical protein CDIK_2231 [Cucumispora dikerogammari]